MVLASLTEYDVMPTEDVIEAIVDKVKNKLPFICSFDLQYCLFLIANWCNILENRQS